MINGYLTGGWYDRGYPVVFEAEIGNLVSYLYTMSLKNDPTLHAMQGRSSTVLNVDLCLDLQWDKTYLSRFHVPHFSLNQSLFKFLTFTLPLSTIFSAI